MAIRKTKKGTQFSRETNLHDLLNASKGEVVILEISNLLNLTVLVSPEELELLIGLSWLMN
jgi:hypothetical protein